MREKQQAVVSWLVIFLVVLGVFFPLRALVTYGRSPAVNAPEPTAAAMLTALVETQTPTAAGRPLETKTPEVTRTVEETAIVEPVFPEGPVPAAPEKTTAPEPDATEIPAAPPFHLQPGSPRYIPPFTYTGQDCRWLGIAGQVFDEQAQPLPDVAVFVSGTLEGQPLNLIAVTGSHPAYGPGGYEIILSDHIPSAPAELTIQLYDLAGDPLSEPAVLQLPLECGQNLMLVNFRAGNEWGEYYLPLITEP